MVRFLVIIFLMLFSLTSQAAVWVESNQWSPAFEARFSEWVRTEWRTDFFSRKLLSNGQKNPYHGLRVDCADTVYSMRLIFAYENRLPFVIQDPTASGRTISNKMSRWDGQSEIQKVRNFLYFIYEVGSTRSLPNDTYPVAVSRDNIRSGALILTTKTNHHSWTVKEILPIGVPYLVYNSVVGAHSGLGLKERQSWPNPAWVFEGDFSVGGNGGFRYWRPAASLNRPVWEVPGYSDEQYRIPLSKWVRYVQSRLAVRTETDDQMFTRLMKAACAELNDRVGAVTEALVYLNKNPRCMKYVDYDNYSTPSRDQRAYDELIGLRRAYRETLQINGGNQISPAILAQLNKIFPAITQSAKSEVAIMQPQSITAASVCETEYLPGKLMDLAEWKRRMFAGLISNNPHDPGSIRWGEIRGPSQRARSCESWDHWAPDLKD
ncbi:hypothetical protein [Bdellovibrio reynosensis]|uniref:Uncharacterized protein n=1 Tax=Bdellovibrio reynosensis TaxID=2835041 RepID=A0ABY4C9H1_9BACT|nr:hypothetical protein [Bdellovibrio reynosensis]UOF01429.1 hypothetical protein MNR06_00490 [Bdellovibrio reynosensis]